MILGIFRLVSNHWIISPGVLHICRMIDQWSINLIMGKIMGQDDNMDLKINGRLTSEASYFLNMSQNLGKWRWSYSYRLNQDFSWENAGFPGAETAEFRGTWELQHGPVVNTFETGIGMIPLDVMGYKSYIYTYTCIYQIQVLYIYMYICICIVIYICIYIVSICLALNITWAVDILDGIYWMYLIAREWLENLWTVNGESPRRPPDKPWYLVICNTLLLKMVIEIVDFPMKNGDFP